MYWTPTGKAQSKGRWQAARDRDQQARQTAADATKRLDALETSFGELETARGRLKGIERELADETAQEQRAGQIGRASCRERVCQYGKLSVVAVTRKKKENKKDKRK